MNRTEHLLTIAAEECAEVAQRCAKANRFGMEQIQEEADDKPEENPERLTNAERIRREYSDLAAVLEMLGIGAPLGRWMDEKKLKVEKYLLRSERCGTLQVGCVSVSSDSGIGGLPSASAEKELSPLVDHEPETPERGWQPIETAPKGKEVLVWKAGSESHIVAIWTHHHQCWVTAWAHDPIGVAGFGPTHWMPLPLPPEESR